MQKLNLENPISETKIEIDYDEIKKSSNILRALYNPVRREILEYLELQPDKKAGVTKMYTDLRREQNVISQHLAILRQATIVNCDREGVKMYYCINYMNLEYILKMVSLLNAGL